MTLRMTALAVFIAALPITIEVPPDSTERHGETRLDLAGGGGQYGIVTRGCDNQVIDVQNVKLGSAALVLEHETPDGLVIGARAGIVHEESDEHTILDPYGGGVTIPAGSLDNRYVNPFLSYEGSWAGIGGGWLHAEHPFAWFGEESSGWFGGERRQIDGTGHVRFGNRDGTSFTVRFMEDVPLQSAGIVTLDLAFHPTPRVAIGPMLGTGPYDGTMVGFRSTLWLAPLAAAQLNAEVGDHSQVSVSGGVRLRWPAPR